MADTEETPKNKGGRRKGQKDRKPRKKKWTPEGVRILKDVGQRARARGLAPKHRQAINEFFKNGYNKKEALRKVGYAESVVAQYWTIFDRTDVAAEIERRHLSRQKRVEATVEAVVEEYRKLAFVNPGKILLKLRENKFNLACLSEEELLSVQELSEEDFSIGRGEEAVAAIKTKVKMSDKRAALKDLGQHLGMFQDKKTDTLEISIADLLAAGRARFQKKDE